MCGLQKQQQNAHETSLLQPSAAAAFTLSAYGINSFASLRHTELLVLVPASQSSVGLHCFNLTIHRVTVDGVQAQVCSSCSETVYKTVCSTADGILVVIQCVRDKTGAQHSASPNTAASAVILQLQAGLVLTCAGP